MRARGDYTRLSPGGYRAMLAFNDYVEGCGLDHRLLELVKLRASQINRCAFCVDMHGRALRQAGESDVRIDGLVAWRESPFYDARERAALAWAEAVTLLSETGAPDADFDELRRHFNEREAADLTFAIALINSWNRLAVGFRTPPTGKD